MRHYRPLFILCPLRSFSSVVSAMIGQHPDLYGLPEVNLFIADSVREVMQLHSTRPHAAHGLYRALAQLQHGEQTEKTVEASKAWVAAHLDWSIKQLFEYLLDFVYPRFGVDKSPRTVMKPEFLQRMHSIFPDAYYLHLTRHPRSTGKSMKELLKRKDEWSGFFNTDWVDPERVWLRSHQNVTQFTSSLPEGQAMRIKGEDLLSEPYVYLPQIAEWLGIRTDDEAIEAMLHPECSPFASFGPANAKYGNDPNFLELPSFRHSRIIEPSLQEGLDWAQTQIFSKPTLKLAKEFGYH